MKTDYIKFLSNVSTIRLTGPDRTFAIAAAVASSVADFIAVPAAKVDSAVSEFARSGAMIARDHVGAFNEVAPFDVRLSLELVRKFWMMRYETIHVRRVHTTTPDDYFCGYFNVARNFSREEMDALNRMATHIGALEIGIRDILQKLKDAQEAKNAEVAANNGEAIATVSPISAPVC